MTETRQHIILAACKLLENQGYPATSLDEIVRESGAPKGSLYYYFPEGKEQLVSEAVLFSGKILIERMRDELAKYVNPFEALYKYVLQLASKVEEKKYVSSNPLTIVAVEAAGSSDRISQACLEVYSQIQEVLFEKMVCCGMSETEALQRSRLMLASLEGGIILSRVHRTVDPLLTLAAHLKESLLSFELPPSNQT